MTTPMMTVSRPRSSGTQPIANSDMSQAPYVLDDFADLLVGEQRSEPGHASAALAVATVQLAELRAALQERDELLVIGEVGVDRAAGEVPAVGTLPGHPWLVVAPAERVTPRAAVGTCGQVEVEQRLADGLGLAVGDRPIGGGGDVGLQFGGQVARRARQRIVL